MGKVKILLISDLHLGMEKVNSLISGEERTNTLKRIFTLAHKHDILLVAGDLIQNHDIEEKYYNILKEEFSALKNEGKEIFYTPGPGELTSGNLVNPEIMNIGATFVFSDDKIQSFVKSSFGDIFIYGLQNNSSNKDWNIERTEVNGFHIGLFHTDFNPQNGGKPESRSIKKDDIKRMNLDFYALGKNHNFKLFRLSNKILGAYPGSPEPCSIDESGDRFVVSFEVEDNTLNNFKRIAVNTGKILSDEIDCGTLINESSLYEKIRSTYPDQSIVSITLTGERDFIVENNFKAGLAGYLRGLKITDTSYPSLKVMMEENIKNDSLKGSFFQALSERMRNVPADKIRSEILAELLSGKNHIEKVRGESFAIFKS